MLHVIRSGAQQARLPLYTILLGLILSALSPATLHAGIPPEDPINNGDPGCNGVGNPVHLATGNKFHREVDIDLTTPMSPTFQFIRYYNSDADFTNMFGVGKFGSQWSHNYNTEAQVHYKFTQWGREVDYVKVEHADGRVVLYDYDKWIGLDRIRLKPQHPGIRERIEADITSQSNYMDLTRLHMYTGDGGVSTFEPGHISNRFLLAQVTDQLGRSLVLTYQWDANSGYDRLQRIESTSGQYLDFEYVPPGYIQSGQISQIWDHSQRSYRYWYNGKILRQSQLYQDRTTYHYERSGKPSWLTGITDRRGVRYATYEYENHGRVIRSKHAGGADAIEIRYNDYSDRRTVVNALGKETRYQLKRNGKNWNITNVEGLPSLTCLGDTRDQTFYAGTGWLETTTSTSGKVTRYSYYTDPNRYGLLQQRVEAEGSPDQRTFTFDWNNYRQLTRRTLQGRQRTDYTYDLTSGRPTGKTITDLTTDTEPYSTNGNTRSWSYFYAFHDALETQIKTVTIRGPGGIPDSTSYHFGTGGQLTRVDNAAGDRTLYQLHTALGDPQRVIDANNVRTRLGYDVYRRLVSVIEDEDGVRATTRLIRDAEGQVTELRLADSSKLVMEYDNARRLIGVSNNLGEKLVIEPNAMRGIERITTLDSEGSTTRILDYQLDELNRVIALAGQDGQQTRFAFNAGGQLETINDGVNPATVLDHDTLSRVKTVTDAAGGIARFGYDVLDNVTSITDQRGLETRQVYDGFGNLKLLSSPDTGDTVSYYDANGNMTSRTDARGVTTNYDYDDLDRLIEVEYPAEPQKNISYIYGNDVHCPESCAGRLSKIIDSSGSTVYAYDSLGRVKTRVQQVKLPGGATTSLTTAFHYNLAGRLTGIDYPNGQQVSYMRDAAGQVDSVRRQNPGETDQKVVAIDVGYEPFGPLSAMTYGSNLTLNREFDLDGRLEEQQLGGLQQLTYDYDAVNNIDTINDLLDSSRSRSYGYDALNRLTDASGKFGTIGYDYDAVGNRTTRNVERDGSVLNEIYHYIGDNNRLQGVTSNRDGSESSRLFIYDDAGNLTGEARSDGYRRILQYDATNRMIGVSP